MEDLQFAKTIRYTVNSLAAVVTIYLSSTIRKNY